MGSSASGRSRLRVLAFYASARGPQLGPGVAVIAFTSVAAKLAGIMGGIDARANAGRRGSRTLALDPKPCPPNISTICESRLSTPSALRLNKLKPTDNGPIAPHHDPS